MFNPIHFSKNHDDVDEEQSKSDYQHAEIRVDHGHDLVIIAPLCQTVHMEAGRRIFWRLVDGGLDEAKLPLLGVLVGVRPGVGGVVGQKPDVHDGARPGDHGPVPGERDPRHELVDEGGLEPVEGGDHLLHHLVRQLGQVVVQEDGEDSVGDAVAEDATPGGGVGVAEAEILEGEVVAR